MATIRPIKYAIVRCAYFKWKDGTKGCYFLYQNSGPQLHDPVMMERTKKVLYPRARGLVNELNDRGLKCELDGKQYYPGGVGHYKRPRKK